MSRESYLFRCIFDSGRQFRRSHFVGLIVQQNVPFKPICGQFVAIEIKLCESFWSEKVGAKIWVPERLYLGVS